MAIKNGKEIMLDSNTRLLLQGASGSGKTSLGGKCTRYDGLRPLHVLDFDLRIASLRTTLDAGDLDHLTYEEFRDGALPGKAWQDAVLWLNKMLLAYKKEDPALPRTIMLDSLTYALRSAMVGVLHTDGKPTDTMPYQDHYGKMGAKGIDFISKLTSLPCNIIVNVHDDIREDPITQRMMKDLALTKMMRNGIPGYFNERWHCEVTPGIQGKAPKFMVRTVSDHTVDARTCYKSLDPLESAEEVWRKVQLEKGMYNI